MPRLNVSKLVSGRTGDAAVTKGLHDAVRQMLHREGWHGDRDIDTSATGSWAKLSKVVFEVAKEELGMSRRKRFDWFDDNDKEVEKLLRAKHDLWRRVVGSAGTMAEAGLRTQYRKLLADIRKAGVYDSQAH